MDSIYEPKTLRSLIISDAFKAFIKKGNTPYYLSNQKHVKALYYSFIDFVVNFPNRNKFSKHDDVIRHLKTFSINGYSSFGEYLKKNYENFKKKKFDMRIIKKSGKKPQENAKKMIEGRTSYEGMDLERTIVVRSQYGNTQVMFYPFYGALTQNNKQLNLIKMQYHFDTGCDYYKARPILFDTWINIPEDNYRRWSTTKISYIGKED